MSTSSSSSPSTTTCCPVFSDRVKHDELVDFFVYLFKGGEVLFGNTLTKTELMQSFNDFGNEQKVNTLRQNYDSVSSFLDQHRNIFFRQHPNDVWSLMHTPQPYLRGRNAQTFDPVLERLINGLSSSPGPLAMLQAILAAHKPSS
jgi:hypothetical protein